MAKLAVGTKVKFGAYCSATGEMDNTLEGAIGVVLDNRVSKSAEYVVGVSREAMVKALACTFDRYNPPTTPEEYLADWNEDIIAACQAQGLYPVEASTEEFVVLDA